MSNHPWDDDLPDDQQIHAYYDGDYAWRALQVGLAMKVSDKPCCGGPEGYGEWGARECDEGCPCVRHGHIPAIVDRYLRMKGRQR